MAVRRMFWGLSFPEGIPAKRIQDEAARWVQEPNPVPVKRR